MRVALDRIREHPRHLLLGAFVAGLLVAPLGTAAVASAAAGAALSGGRTPLALLAAAVLLAGVLVAGARVQALDAGVLHGASGRTIVARVTLLEPVRERAAGPAVARVRLLEGFGRGEQAVLRVRRWAYTTRGDGWPEVGDILSVRGRVQPLGLPDAYQARRNAHAAITATRVTATGTRRGGVAGVLDSIRRRAEAGLDAALDPSEAALLRGMVLGEDERLDETVREDFQRSGLAHILAVSGSNVMLLVVLVLGTCALAGVPLHARLVLSAAVVVLYVPLAGGGPSIQRAGVMGVAGLVAALAGRRTRRWYALLLAAAATLVLNPRSASEPGWQLSFAAVAALLIGAPRLREPLARRVPNAVADAAAITLAATIGTAPLMALHFGQVSLAALPANLLAAPAIAPIMWLGVLAATAAQFAPALATPFSALTAPLLVYVQEVAATTAALPLSVVGASVAPVLGVPIAVVWIVRRMRRIRVAVAAGVAVAVVLALAAGLSERGASAPQPGPNELVVSFLDIGQGDATLIQLGDTTVLVDTGPPDGPILKRLEESGVKHLDALFLTHAEADHEGAALSVIRRYPPRLLVDGGAGWSSPVQRRLPAAIAAARARELRPATGQVIAIGRLRFELLWPPPVTAGEPLGGNRNDRALVARLEVGTFSMLLTADAESNVTGRLALEPVDVLKVAHHGSADPGLPQLLARLRPKVAAIEVGRHNEYGHPTPSTLAALEQAVPTVLRTDRDGTVRLHVLRDRMWVRR